MKFVSIKANFRHIHLQKVIKTLLLGPFIQVLAFIDVFADFYQTSLILFFKNNLFSRYGILSEIAIRGNGMKDSGLFGQGSISNQYASGETENSDGYHNNQKVIANGVKAVGGGRSSEEYGLGLFHHVIGSEEILGGRFSHTSLTSGTELLFDLSLELLDFDFQIFDVLFPVIAGDLCGYSIFLFLQLFFLFFGQGFLLPDFYSLPLSFLNLLLSDHFLLLDSLFSGLSTFMGMTALTDGVLTTLVRHF